MAMNLLSLVVYVFHQPKFKKAHKALPREFLKTAFRGQWTEHTFKALCCFFVRGEIAIIFMSIQTVFSLKWSYTSS